MNRPDSSTSPRRSFSSGIRGAYCALTSTRGIIGASGQSRGPPADHQVADCSHHEPENHDRDVGEIVVEAVVAGPERPSAGGEPEAEDAAAEERKRHEASERHA